MLRLARISLVTLCCMLIIGCSTHDMSVVQKKSELQQGKRLFSAGLYKRSMRWLLPLATDGDAEAQYAVGYMYYYGYGVTQDTETGYFWIKRSADQGYEPAQQALKVINKQGGPG